MTSTDPIQTFTVRRFSQHERTQMPSRDVGTSSLDRGTPDPRLPLGHGAAGSCHEDINSRSGRRKQQQ